MFADNITFSNASFQQEAKAECGDDLECLFDVASTNDLSIGQVTKEISIQLVNETNTLSKPEKLLHSCIEMCFKLFDIVIMRYRFGEVLNLSWLIVR